MSQQQLADILNINRTTLSSYESGAQPTFQVQLRISDYFKISIDAFIRYNLSKLSEFKLSEIERGYDVDITGEKLRLLTLSVDKDGKENIELVNVKAQAGYANGYADPEFVQQLPKFQIPILQQQKTYRAFQIEGDSMLPYSPNSWVVCSYVQNWTNVAQGARCVVVTKADGVVFKHLYLDHEHQEALLVSANAVYSPYVVPVAEISELWLAELSMEKIG